MDSDQHQNVGSRGSNFLEENKRGSYQRSLSDGNFTSTAIDIGQNEESEHRYPEESQAKSNVLSESSPEISTCESDSSYSRYAHSMPRRQLFVDTHSDDYPNSDRIFYNKRLDSFNCSNFLDVDWISSSGNSCEDESYERLTCSPFGCQSSENVVKGMCPVPCDSESCLHSRGEEQGGGNQAAGEYPDAFVKWVMNGGMFMRYTVSGKIDEVSSQDNKMMLQDVSNMMQVSDDGKTEDNTKLAINRFNERNMVEIESFIRETIQVNNLRSEEIAAAYVSMDTKFQSDASDLKSCVNDSLMLDQEMKKEFDSMSKICVDHLTCLGDKHGDSTKSMLNQADGLKKDYQPYVELLLEDWNKLIDLISLMMNPAIGKELLKEDGTQDESAIDRTWFPVTWERFLITAAAFRAEPQLQCPGTRRSIHVNPLYFEAR
ncbi:phosphoinositide phosphatase SAC2-like protein isoform X2 [Tanacetum coccineum]